MKIRQRFYFFIPAFITSLVALAQALTINVTFIDEANQTWTAERQSVINQAANDWESAIGDSQTISLELGWTNAGSGGYLAQWQGSGSFFAGTDIYPWTSGIEHRVQFNADLADDIYFGLGTVPPSDWDALSIARHEMGHMMGFAVDFYVDDFTLPSEFDKWTSHIANTTFDPGGLNIEMAGSSNLGHVANSGSTLNDLMIPALVNGARRNISQTDLNMLEKAYGYTIIPEPTTALLLLLAIAIVAVSRYARYSRMREV